MESPAITYRDHARALLRLGMPLVLSHVAQFAIFMTDALMLGWYSVTALAASAIGGTFFFLTFIVGSGFAQAVTPLAAEAAEQGNEQGVRRATRMGMWLSAIYGAFIMIPFFWAEEILLAIGQDLAVAALGQDYLRIVGFSMIPALLVMTMKSFLAAIERTAIILWATFGMALLNAIINYALIFGNWGAPELGIQGAAIASLTITVLTLVILMVYALRETPQYRLLQNIFAPDQEVMAKVFALGWPIGLTALAEGGLFSASTTMMGWLGAVPQAAHGIALQLSGMTFMFHLGLSQAATVRVGRAWARGDTQNLRRGAIVACFLSAGFGCLTMLVFWAIPGLLVAGFVDGTTVDGAAVVAIGISLLLVSAMFQVVDGLQAMALGMLRGLQDTQVPMVIAIVSYWGVGLPVSLWLGFGLGWGGVGVWLGLVAGLLVAAILLMQRFWRHKAIWTDVQPSALA
ncbi:MAG: MATE family efflux transporter [Pseudomonadota bacterium]